MPSGRTTSASRYWRGSLSLEVGGPAVNPGSVFGVPAPQWAEQVGTWLAHGETDALLRGCTRAQLAAAGNVGGELLNSIAMLGAVDAGLAEYMRLQPEFAHGYGFWNGGP